MGRAAWRKNGLDREAILARGQIVEPKRSVSLESYDNVCSAIALVGVDSIA